MGCMIRHCGAKRDGFCTDSEFFVLGAQLLNLQPLMAYASALHLAKVQL